MPETDVSHGDAGVDVSYRFEWRVPEGVNDAALPIVREIVRRGRRNEHLGDRQEGRRRLWSSLNLLLGAPAAVLAGISGAVILGDPSANVLAGIIALASAALGALLTFLTPSQRATRAEVAANRYWLISAWVRFVVAADLPTADPAKARALLLELQRREETVMTTAISGAPPEASGRPTPTDVRSDRAGDPP
jgi:hypothetical protein